MDPVTVIMAALAAGATAGLSNAGSSAIADTYAGLKLLIKTRFEGNRNAEQILADHESDPEVYEKPLEKQIKATGADQDEAILRAAEKLLKDVDAARVTTKYKVTIKGNVGIVGDHGHVKM